jgi:UDP-glucose 4-epimerase
VPSSVLVAGGAGYIGSHVCLRLAERGYAPVTYDDLSNGHADFVQWGALERGDIRDAARLAEVFALHRPVAVIHLAGLIEVGQSTADPAHFYDINVGGSVSLAKAAETAGVRAVVFSSSCAVYGAPLHAAMDETHPTSPLNPYGRTKLVVEEFLQEMARWKGMSSLALRYFNAAGADPQGRIGERHDPETHLVPLAIDAALGRRGPLSIFGADYPTPDGTAVRDYVHVADLADAHVRAVERLLETQGEPASFDAVNLGSGQGASVRELVEAVGQAVGSPVPTREAPRRAGDASSLVADITKAGRVLGWRPGHTLETIVDTAVQWARAEAGRNP